MIFVPLLRFWVHIFDMEIIIMSDNTGLLFLFFFFCVSVAEPSSEPNNLKTFVYRVSGEEGLALS